MTFMRADQFDAEKVGRVSRFQRCPHWSNDLCQLAKKLGKTFYCNGWNFETCQPYLQHKAGKEVAA